MRVASGALGEQAVRITVRYRENKLNAFFDTRITTATVSSITVF